MKRGVLIAAIVLLVAPSEALAKDGDVRAIRICGSNRCVTLSDYTQLQIVLSIDAYGTGNARREHTPYYTISTVPPSGRRPLYRYAPSASVAQERSENGGAWLVVPPFVRDLIYWQATRDLQPFSATDTRRGTPAIALAAAGATAAIVLVAAFMARRRQRNGTTAGEPKRA